jgi:copper transport protein
VVRGIAGVLALFLLCATGLFAHAGLRLSSPIEGATLGDTPSAVQLTLWEKAEPALSMIRVIDTQGVTYDIGRPGLVPGDPLSLSVAVRPLGAGVYTVRWRVVSAVDGHASAGAYAFGVRVSPGGAATASAPAATSRFEMAARWVLLAGLVALLGAAAADLGRFGGPADMTLGACGWLLSVVGVILLTAAQTRTAAAPLTDVLNTSVGRMLIWRAAAIGVAGVALAAAHAGTRWRRPRLRLVAAAIAALATLATIGVHAAAGHAAAGRWHPPTTILVQWAHFAACGVWLGGLAALLLGTRGATSGIGTASLRRFSTIAGVGIVIVASTGAWRAVNELASWDDLTTTSYGRLVLVKSVLLAAIASLGAINRWHSIAAAVRDLRPLRRFASGELGLAAGAIAAAAMLGTYAPPAAEQFLPGIQASAADFATTVRIRLRTASDQPGPNRFRVEAVDYDSNKPVHARRVSLKFVPVDDPGVAPTWLPLAAGPDDSYVGSGVNLSFDGRWLVTALVERDRDSVEVPMTVDVRTPTQSRTVERSLGQAPMYTVEVRGMGFIRFSPDPERPGPSKLAVTCFNGIFEDRPIDGLMVTVAAGSAPPRQVPVRRLDRSRFVADVDFRAGLNRIAAVARTVDGGRMRAVVDIDVTGR